MDPGHWSAMMLIASAVKSTVVVVVDWQKNPSTIRHPEEVRGMETFEMDITLNVAAAHIVSPHISPLCHDAAGSMTFARSPDLRLLAQSNYITLLIYLLLVM